MYKRQATTSPAAKPKADAAKPAMKKPSEKTTAAAAETAKQAASKAPAGEK